MLDRSTAFPGTSATLRRRILHSSPRPGRPRPTGPPTRRTESYQGHEPVHGRSRSDPLAIEATHSASHPRRLVRSLHVASSSDWVRAWKPAVPGIHEVLYARFVDHMYPPHTH